MTATSTPSSPPDAPAPARDLLDAVTIDVPCTVPWDSMTGDARRRFCATCRLHVHDVSQISRDEALSLLGRKASGERVCLRIWRRPDGRVLTRDCRSAVKALRRRAALAVTALLGALGIGGFAWLRAQAAEEDGVPIWEVEPFRSVASVLPASWFPASPAPPPLVGDIIMPAVPPTPTPGPAGGGE